MEQQNRSAIVLLACAGHTAKDIVKLKIIPKATVTRVFKRFREESKVDTKEHKTWKDSKRIPRFLIHIHDNSCKETQGISFYSVSRSQWRPWHD